MFAFLVQEEFRPFTVAALIVLGLLVIEAGGMLVGASLSHVLQGAFGAHAPHVPVSHHADASESLFGKALGWLNVGRVPVLLLLVAFIAGFAVTGMVMQILAGHFAAPLPVGPACVAAAAAALPCTRWFSQLAALLLPNDETYVLEGDDLIGRVGVVTLGPVADGVAARIKVRDRYGNWHFPRVSPAQPGGSIAEGASVLIVDRNGGVLSVIAAEGHLDTSKT